MQKIIYSIAYAIGATLLVQPFIVSSQANQPVQSNSISKSNKDVLQKLAAGGAAEVQASQLALTKTNNKEVKKFAQQMVTDHTKANSELRNLALNKDIELSFEPDTKHKNLMSRLQKLSGKQFDKVYLNEVGHKDHRNTEKALESLIRQTQDSDIRAFAQRTLDVVKEHMSMLGDVRSTQQSSSNQPG